MTLSTSSEKTFQLEVCVDSVESAMAAERGGADRVELCASLWEGGTTPSAGAIAAARERLGIKLHVMIRPRGGDFCYSEIEFDVMQRDISLAKQLGADGVVFGLLKTDGSIDVERTRVLIEMARPLNVTFHRAFDMTSDPWRALEDLIALGVDRILTSGQESSVVEGLDLITELVKRADNRIIIMPGGGLNERNIQRVVARSGVREVHVSGRVSVESEMQYRNERVFMGGALRPPEYLGSVTDAEKISRLRQMARAGLVCLLFWCCIIPFASVAATSCMQASATALASSAQITPLPIGALLEGELQDGESRSYQLSLPAEYYAQVIVMQKGLDLTAAIYAPTGERVASGDRANQMHGPKSLHLVTTAHQDYRLEIRAAKEAKPGRYSVELVTARPATPREQQLFSAQTIFSTAIGLANERTPEARRQAREKFVQALALYRAAENVEGQALTLTELGLVTYWLSERRQSIEWYQQALPLWRSINDAHGEARVLNNLGVSYSNLGELQEAENYYQQALPVWRRLGDHNGEARTLNNISAIQFLLGDWQQALSIVRQAAALWHEAGDRRGEPTALNSLGVIYAELGDHAQALDYHQQALAMARSVENKPPDLLSLETRILNNLGEIYIMRREEAQALHYLNEALALRRERGDREGQAMTLTDIAFVHGFAGRREQALETYEEALKLARETGYRWVEGTILKKLGEILTSEQPERARESFQAALKLFRAAEEKEAETETLYGLAKLERAQSNTAAARAHIEASLALAESLRTKVGSHDLRALFFANKQDYFETYIDLLMQEHQANPKAGYDQLALQASERARARSLLELLAEARAEIHRGVPTELLDRLQKLRALIMGKTNRHLGLKNSQTTTAEELSASEAEIRRLTTEYEQVEAQIRALPHYGALAQPQPLKLSEIQAQLDAQTILLQYSLGQERSYLWMVSRDALESHVLPGRAKIEAAAQQVYELLTAHQPRLNESPAQRLARERTADEQYWPAAMELSQMLLGPVAERLGEKRLIVVPDGGLHYVSFNALPKPEAEGKSNQPLTSNLKPLILEHEMAYLPSASVLALQRRERPTQPVAQQAIALFADPVFSADDLRVTANSKASAPKSRASMAAKNQKPAKLDFSTQVTRSVPSASWLRSEITLPRLLNSRREAQAIASLVPRDSSLVALDFQANREEAVRADLKRYRIIHFATHALLNDEHPALSGIVLSLVDAKGSPQPGFLQLHDIYNLDLAADLVVLSACRTARGQAIKGEGIIGLTRGFLYSGAQRVVSSLWDVDDAATSELMTRFYQAMLKHGLRPAAALRQAQIALWEQRPRRSPYFWSAFVLHGEWQ